MEEGSIKVQGRWLKETDIRFISEAIANNGTWGRRKLSLYLCEQWNWRDESDRLKDIACRTLLRKLEGLGRIKLPEPKGGVRQKGFGISKSFVPCAHSTEPINSPLSEISPISVKPVGNRTEKHLWETYLHSYHYLSFRTLVGRSLSYMVYDCHNRELGCLLFGAAAWKCAPRDRYIGWSNEQRENNLHRVINNMRYLILPWVRVPHLASHILGHLYRRIEEDWYSKYKSEIMLLETFVEKGRFQGTCYKAANWICVGETTGRTRQDRHNCINAPIKSIYLLPLDKQFREKLNCAVGGNENDTGRAM